MKVFASKIRAQSGNILFLILLAVVLFAALSYAVTQSMRGGGKDSSEEDARSLAASITQYGTLLSNGLQRFMLANNLRIDQIDLIHPTDSGFFLSNNGNNSACTTTSCNLFATEGGGITPLYLPEKATDITRTGWSITGGQSKGYWMVASVQDVGTSAPEVLLLYGAVKSKVCEQFNILNGVKTESDTYVYDIHGVENTDYRQFMNYVPAMPALTANAFGNEDARIRGKRMFCSQNTSNTPTNLFGNYLYMVVYEQ